MAIRRTALGELWPGQSVALLKALHILTREGALNADSRRKLKQVLHLAQLIKPAIDGAFAEKDQPVLADLGAGKSYLGFILYDLYFGKQGRGTVVGVEARHDLIETSKRIAAESGFDAHAVCRKHDRRGEPARRQGRHRDGAACLRHRDRRGDPVRAAPRGEVRGAGALLPGGGRGGAGEFEEAGAPALAPSDPAPRIRRTSDQCACAACSWRRTATRCG